MSFELKDIKQEIKVEEYDIDIKCENGTETNDSTGWDVQDSVNDYDNVYTSASIKKEYCEEEENIAYNKNNVKNEINIDIKEEILEDKNDFENVLVENCEEDPSVNCKTEIGIDEDPLHPVKKEPMSDSEEPQDTPGILSILSKGNTLKNDKSKDSVEGKNTCGVCNKSFSHKWTLDIHMRIHTGVKPFECHICKKEFNIKGNLNRHVRTHFKKPPEPILSSEEDEVKRESTEALQDGSSKKKAKNKCKICKKKFFHKCTLEVHMRIHTGEQPFECEICKTKFNIKGNLNRHMRTHISIKLHQCAVCKKKYTLKANLDNHMRVHNAKNAFECDVCHETFKKSPMLTKHMRIHPPKRLFECEICKKKFIKKYHIEDHMRTHTGERPFECEICKKRFIQKFHLNVHLRKHTGERPYPCSICKKSFVTKPVLTKHMRVHTGERPYQCTLCLKNFTQKNNFYIHMRIHTGERPYECEICQKTFVQKNHYDKHLRIHSDEKTIKQETIGPL